MPKIQRSSIPPELLQHLLRRAREREITLEMLHQVLRWVEQNPPVPEGDWFKRFPGVIVCGRDALIRTFLMPQQTAVGTEIQ
jgi:hypothetical protein